MGVVAGWPGFVEEQSRKRKCSISAHEAENPKQL